MKQFLQLLLTFSLALVIASANSSVALADEGPPEGVLEVEVNGYHIALDSQNDWKKGENTILVSIKDSAGTPVSHADVELLIVPGKADEPSASHADHGASEVAPVHGGEQGHSALPDTDRSQHLTEAWDTPADTEATQSLVLTESAAHGTYLAETHLESTGAHQVNVMFHVNGEMFQADFVVQIANALSKPAVLWSFAAINVVLIASAGLLKRQSVPAKGAK